MAQEKSHRLAVERAIEIASARSSDFHEVLLQCEGADPVLVAKILEEGKHGTLLTAASPPATHTQELLVRLPAPDAFRSQWWFTGETVAYLAKRAANVAPKGKILCLGTPM